MAEWGKIRRGTSPEMARRRRRAGHEDHVPRGGYREGAGRPTLFPGKDRRITVSLTQTAVDVAEALADRLRSDNPDVPVSTSDAVEYALLELRDGRGWRFRSR